MTSTKALIEKAISIGRDRPPVNRGESTVFPGVMEILEEMLAEESVPLAQRRDLSDSLGRTALDDARVVESEFGEAVGDVLVALEGRRAAHRAARDIRER
jgi:hypothetical protein